MSATLIGGVLIAALATWALLQRRSVTNAEPIRFSITLPASQKLAANAGIGARYGAALALSPDGRHLLTARSPMTVAKWG